MVGAGSLLLATPVLQAIREKFPEGGFFLVGTKAVTGFAEGSGDDDLKELGAGNNRLYGDSFAKKPSGKVSGGG